MLNRLFGKKVPELQKQGLKQKVEHYHRGLHIRNSLGTKFQLKLTILNF